MTILVSEARVISRTVVRGVSIGRDVPYLSRERVADHLGAVRIDASEVSKTDRSGAALVIRRTVRVLDGLRGPVHVVAPVCDVSVLALRCNAQSGMRRMSSCGVSLQS